MSRFISQPLALHALQKLLCAFGVVDAIGNAVGIPEIELSEITV